MDSEPLVRVGHEEFLSGNHDTAFAAGGIVVCDLRTGLAVGRLQLQIARAIWQPSGVKGSHAKLVRFVDRLDPRLDLRQQAGHRLRRGFATHLILLCDNSGNATKP